MIYMILTVLLAITRWTLDWFSKLPWPPHCPTLPACRTACECIRSSKSNSKRSNCIKHCTDTIRPTGGYGGRPLCRSLYSFPLTTRSGAPYYASTPAVSSSAKLTFKIVEYLQHEPLWCSNTFNYGAQSLLHFCHVTFGIHTKGRPCWNSCVTCTK